MEEIPLQIASALAGSQAPLQDAIPPWNQDELARKLSFLPEDARLNHNAMRVIRCAECIFGRPVFPGDSPSCTLAEIESCTTIDKAVIQVNLDKLVQWELLEKGVAPVTTLRRTSTNPPYVYRPIADQDGSSFFEPNRKPGCERTFIQNILERLTSVQGGVLQTLSELAVKGTRTIAQDQVRDHNKRGSLQGAFELFCRAEILRQVEDCEGTPRSYAPAAYAFTERGLWLMSQLSDSELPQ